MNTPDNYDEIAPAAAQTGGFTPIPSGLYKVVIVKATEKYAQSGNTGIGLQLAVTEGKYTKRRVFDDLWLSAVERLKLAALALGVVLEKGKPILLDDFCGRECVVSVGLDLQDTTRNKVGYAGYFKLEEWAKLQAEAAAKAGGKNKPGAAAAGESKPVTTEKLAF